MTPELEKLEELAKAATPGPWEKDYRGTVGHIKSVATPDGNTPTLFKYKPFFPGDEASFYAKCLITPDQQEINAAFIAFANPALSLLSSLREKEREKEWLYAKWEAAESRLSTLVERAAQVAEGFIREKTMYMERITAQEIAAEIRKIKEER